MHFSNLIFFSIPSIRLSTVAYKCCILSLTLRYTTILYNTSHYLYNTLHMCVCCHTGAVFSVSPAHLCDVCVHSWLLGVLQWDRHQWGREGVPQTAQWDHCRLWRGKCLPSTLQMSSFSIPYTTESLVGNLNLAVYITTTKISYSQYFQLYIHMVDFNLVVILWRLRQTTKFNSPPNFPAIWYIYGI